MSAPVSAPIIALSEKSGCLPTWFRRAKSVPQLVEAAVKVEAEVEVLVKTVEPVVAEVKAVEEKVEAKLKVRTCFRSCSACDARSAVSAHAPVPVASPVPLKVHKKWYSCFPKSRVEKTVIPRPQRLRCWVKKASEVPATLECRSVVPVAEPSIVPDEVQAPEPSKSE